MRSSPSFSAGGDGFTAVPRHIFDLLLCLSLNKRDLSILLLVVRLTYGCRGNRWARLRQADLSAIGIGPNHARECLCSLLDRKLLLRHGSADAYRLNDTMLLASITPDGAARLDRLAAVVGRNLGETSPSGKPLPETVTQTLPKEELSPSHQGNTSSLVSWHFSRSRGQFVRDFDGAIDKER